MNPSEYLESIKNLLLTDYRIISHQIIREYEGLQKSYIRARLTLMDDSLLEFSEYIEQEAENEFEITDYSFQWMDKDGNQIQRWDNTKHFPKLKNFPRHVHISEDNIVLGEPINIFAVLDEVGKTFKKS